MSVAEDYKALGKLKTSIKSLRIKGALFLLFFLVTFAVASSLLTKSYHWSNVGAYGVAYVMTSIGKGEVKLKIYSDDGASGSVLAKAFSRSPHWKNTAGVMGWRVPLSGLVALLLSVFLSMWAVRFLKGYGSKKVNTKTHLRGARYVEPDVLEQAIRDSGEASEFSIGTLPVPLSIIDRHIYFSGDTGNGKSQALMQILDVVREKDEKLIILDKNGEMTSRYYDPERDYILGPFDDRTQNWTTYCEGANEVDFEKMARSFIPVPPPGSQTHWAESSINVLSTLLDQLSTSSDHSQAVDHLLQKLVESKKVIEKNLLGRDEIVLKRGVYELVKGTIAQLSLDPDAPEHASSVLSSLIPNIRSLSYLRGMGDRSVFSIKDWVKNPNDKGWVFIRVSEDYFELVEPLVRTWLDTAIKAVLSLKKPNDYRIWFVVDELQSLKSINSLKKGLHEGRGHGLRCILGFTSITELCETYGENTAKGMLSQCNTKVSFSVSEPTASEWVAKLLGNEEVIRENDSINFGERDSLGSADQLHESSIVLPSQIQTLPRFTAYVKFSGDWPVTKIKTVYKNRPEVAAHTVERTLPPAFKYEEQEDEEEATLSVAGTQEFREDEPLI